MVLTPTARLTRKKAAQALTDHGYPITPGQLSTLVTRGGGPEFHIFGKHAIYVWGPTLAWAEARCKPSRHSSSERDRLDADQRQSTLNIP
jgi:hypothetical protein